MKPTRKRSPRMYGKRWQICSNANSSNSNDRRGGLRESFKSATRPVSLPGYRAMPRERIVLQNTSCKTETEQLKMNLPRPYALLAEITYRCPLHCPYCSNPVAASLCEAPRGAQGGSYRNGELTTEEWKRVIREAAALGVLQIGFSGGEPLARRDLVGLIRVAREANL